MGFTTIIDILGATIIGGIVLMNLLRMNSNVVQNESMFGHDKNLQVDVVILATIMDRDFGLLGYCGDFTKMDSTAIIYGDSVSIRFLADVDNNGAFDTLYYYTSDTTTLSHTPNPRDRILYRQLNSNPPFVVANNITEFNLNYLDTFANEQSIPIDLTKIVNYVRIAFKVEDPFAYDEEYTEALWRRLTVTANNLIKK
ncbi:hypothetical protein [Ignavibacterium sp.]|uniref:hypothetical protein n=1 Tax=Ignavibacterium sp. TaxID=2651167 RepID=UPI00307EE2B2